MFACLHGTNITCFKKTINTQIHGLTGKEEFENGSSFSKHTQLTQIRRNRRRRKKTSESVRRKEKGREAKTRNNFSHFNDSEYVNEHISYENAEKFIL